MLTNIEQIAPQGAIFDTHCHYDDSAFDADRSCLFDTLAEYGVAGGIICGCDLISSKNCISLAENNKGWYAAAGFHPENLPQTVKDINGIVPLLQNKNVVAVGEIGLDYHWDAFPRDFQKQCFEEQLIIANGLNMPVIVHDRDAHGDTLDILKKHKPKGVLHCFSGSCETAKEVTDLGMYIGVGGSVTFKNSRRCREVAASVPLDRILLETDAPYMTPEPYRGRQNHSGMIIYVAEQIAKIKETDTHTVLKVCFENAKALFGI